MMQPVSRYPCSKALLYVRSGLFFLAMTGLTLVIAPLMVLAFPLPFKVRYCTAQLWVSLVLWLLKKICKIDHHIEGLANIPSGNAIVLCKHQSAWETIALQKIFPPQVFIIKRELLRLPFFGWALATCEPIAIDRKAGKAALRQVVDQGMRRLAKGRWVVIFPEGTRVKPGVVGRYGPGGSVLAHRSGYPVVPVAHNAGCFWPRNGFLKYPGTIQVRIGKPIFPEKLSATEINHATQDWIEAQMREIGA
ncbi:MAG: lysophospholipid acyltransferase family protein [Gammaproteobacteria bacterium]